MINAMSSFGVQNALRRDIVTQDFFFDKSEKIVDYPNINNPQFCYGHIDNDMLAQKRHLYTGDCTPKQIKGCMIQHLIVSKSNSTELVCREYLCDCSHCIDLDFDNCSSSELLDGADNDTEEFEVKEYESYVHQIFDFVEIPSCVTLISERSIEALYFVLAKKGIAEELLRNGFDHVINFGDMFFRGNFFRLVKSRNCNIKKFQVFVVDVITFC